MTESLAQLSQGALSDLAGVFTAMPEDALDGLIEAIVKAKRIVVFGLGREGLQMRGFAMRLFHMGRDVAVWGDMTTPAVGMGDLFIASAGPGDLPTAQTLVEIARKAGARTALVTAQPGRRTRQTRRHRHCHSSADDGQRSGRQAFGPADGLAVRDGADDRLRAGDPQTASALQRNVGDDARAAHESGVNLSPANPPPSKPSQTSVRRVRLPRRSRQACRALSQCRSHSRRRVGTERCARA